MRTHVFLRRCSRMVRLLHWHAGLVAAVLACSGMLMSCSSNPRPSGATPSAPGSSPISPTPAGVDLSGWKLTLPIAGNGGEPGMVDPAAVSAPWLTRDSAGYTFWAPVTGVTTAHSEHARTELVSLSTFHEGSGTHTLRATVTAHQLPSEKPDVILGQIHGAGDILSVPFVMLHYRAGEVDVIVKKEQQGSASTRYPLLSGVPLGAAFDYTISDPGNGSLTFTAGYGPQHANLTAPIPAAFMGATVRFQAGAYQQVNSQSGHHNTNDGARVTFSTLSQGAPAS